MTKTVRLFFVWTALLEFFSAALILRGQSIPSKTIENVKSGVVPLVCLQASSGKAPATIKVIAGSGFFINANGDFVTARHVINDLKTYSQKESCTFAVYLPDAGWATRLPVFDISFFDVKECTLNNQSDVGVCKLISNPFADLKFSKQVTFLRFGGTQNLKDGVPVALQGSPCKDGDP